MWPARWVPRACWRWTHRPTKSARLRAPNAGARVTCDAALADVLLHPEFGYYAGFSREYREKAIAAGHRETLAAAQALRALHAA